MDASMRREGGSAAAVSVRARLLLLWWELLAIGGAWCLVDIGRSGVGPVP